MAIFLGLAAAAALAACAMAADALHLHDLLLAGIGVVLLGLAVLLLYEGIALLVGWPTISQLANDEWRLHPVLWTLAYGVTLVVLGALGEHFTAGRSGWNLVVPSVGAVSLLLGGLLTVLTGWRP